MHLPDIKQINLKFLKRFETTLSKLPFVTRITFQLPSLLHRLFPGDKDLHQVQPVFRLIL
jgi:hypothetical protein